MFVKQCLVFFLQIATLQEDVEYYVESNQDENYEENEFMYDDLELDELSIGTAALAASPTEEFNHPGSNSNSPSPGPTTLTNHSTDSNTSRKRGKSESEDSRTGKVVGIIMSHFTAQAFTYTHRYSAFSFYRITNLTYLQKFPTRQQKDRILRK